MRINLIALSATSSWSRGIDCFHRRLYLAGCLLLFILYDWLLVTRGPRGMCLVDEKNTTEFIQANAQEVFDVSGAGDTVVATLAACLACGESITSAAKTANLAAGIVVGKLGNGYFTIALPGKKRLSFVKIPLDG